MLHFLFIKYTGIACHRDACYVSSHSEACLMKLRQVISTNNSNLWISLDEIPSLTIHAVPLTCLRPVVILRGPILGGITVTRTKRCLKAQTPSAVNDRICRRV